MTEFTEIIQGPTVTLTRFKAHENVKVIKELFALFSQTPEMFIYLPYDLPSSLAEYQAFMESLDPITELYTIRKNNCQELVGMIGYLNLKPAHKVVEVGHITIGKQFHGSGVGKEATLLLLKNALYDLNQYRAEWKTHHLNIGSQKLALKSGFKFEGIFRNHMFVKGMHRNSFYYAIISQERDELLPLFEKAGIKVDSTA
jgi:RimJ/RimL family protein N-acetyltransferase